MADQGGTERVRVHVRMSSPDERRGIEAALPLARRAKLIAAGTPPVDDPALNERVVELLRDMAVPMSVVQKVGELQLAELFFRFSGVAAALLPPPRQSLWSQFCDSQFGSVCFMFLFAMPIVLLAWAYHTFPSATIYSLIGVVLVVLLVVFRRWVVRIPLGAIRLVRRAFRRLEEATRS